MKRSLTCLLALILILAGFAKADTTAAGPCLTSIATYNPADTIALALLALTVSFDVIAIAYIINKIFPSTGIRDWINAEYWEIAKTALLIVSIYAVLSILGNVASLVAPQQLVNPSAYSSGPDFSPSSVSGMYGLVNGACTYLNGETAFEGTTLNYLFGLGWSVGLIRNIQVQAVTKVPIEIVPPIELDSGFLMNIYVNNMILSEPGQAQYQSMLNDLLLIIAVPVTLFTQAQLELLPILFTLGIGVLIPLGLLLRAFPFIRGIGGTFVAIGIGLSLIYPAALVLLNYPVTVALQGTAIPEAPSQCQGGWIICGLTGIVFALFGPAGGAAAGVVTLPGFGDAVGGMVSIFPALNGMLYYSSYMVLQFFLFILDLAIAFPLVDGIAKMLGGKISLSIGGKLKLV